MEVLDRLAEGLAEIFKWVGAAAVAAMLAVTCLDVACRLLGRPVWGLVEIVTLLAVTSLACGLPVTQRRGGHVALDMVVRRLPQRAAAGVDAAGRLVSLVLFALAGWRLWLYAERLREAGQVFMGLDLPQYWLVRLLCFSFGALCLVLLADAFNSLKRMVRP